MKLLAFLFVSTLVASVVCDDFIPIAGILARGSSNMPPIRVHAASSKAQAEAQSQPKVAAVEKVNSGVTPAAPAQAAAQTKAPVVPAKVAPVAAQTVQAQASATTAPVAQTPAPVIQSQQRQQVQAPVQPVAGTGRSIQPVQAKNVQANRPVQAPVQAAKVVAPVVKQQQAPAQSPRLPGQVQPVQASRMGNIQQQLARPLGQVLPIAQQPTVQPLKPLTGAQLKPSLPLAAQNLQKQQQLQQQQLQKQILQQQQLIRQGGLLAPNQQQVQRPFGLNAQQLLRNTQDAKRQSVQRLAPQQFSRSAQPVIPVRPFGMAQQQGRAVQSRMVQPGFIQKQNQQAQARVLNGRVQFQG